MTLRDDATATQTVQNVPDLSTTRIANSLTTIFTPPAACFTDIYDGPVIKAENWILFPTFAPQCYPPTLDLGLAEVNHISPGICPFGYNEVKATVFVATESSTTITYATCCPAA
jgi:hypothetical protein